MCAYVINNNGSSNLNCYSPVKQAHKLCDYFIQCILFFGTFSYDAS